MTSVSRLHLLPIVILGALMPAPAAGQLLGPEVFAGGGPLLEASGFALSGGVALRVLPGVAGFGQVYHSHTEVPLPARTDKVTSVLVGVRLSAFGALPLSPYVLGAYGRGWFRGLAEAEGPTLHLGGGARLRVSGAASLYAEARVALINNASHDADITVPLIAGLILRP